MRSSEIKYEEGIIRYDGLDIPFTGYYGIIGHKQNLLENMLNSDGKTYRIIDIGCARCLQHPKLIDYLETKSRLASKPKRVEVVGFDIAEAFLSEIAKGTFIYEYVKMNKKYFTTNKQNNGFLMRKKWKNRLELVVGDLRDTLPFKNDSFDAVVAENVIYHLPFQYWSKVMEEVIRVLKPTGYFPLSLLEYIKQPD